MERCLASEADGWGGKDEGMIDGALPRWRGRRVGWKGWGCGV